MNISYPHSIENCLGEKIIFKGIVEEPGGDKLIVENFVTPGSGPIMHTHWLQEEGLTIIQGRLGYQVKGHPKQYAVAGQTIIFEKGTPHRFWNAGKDTLHCEGWLKPANTFVFYISSIYKAQNKSGKAQPELFDSAYLFRRYASEYDVVEIPWFVKKIVMPVAYFIGKISGKYKHFKDAPAPVRA